MGYNPHFDRKLGIGLQAEELVEHALVAETHEVKFNSLAQISGAFYIEFTQYTRGAWRPSGISTTQAQRWDLVVDQATGAFVSVPTERLRALTEEAIARGDVRQARQPGDIPTKGALVPLLEVLGVRVIDHGATSAHTPSAGGIREATS